MDQMKSMREKENKDDSKVWGQKTEKKKVCYHLRQENMWVEQV